MDKHGHGNGDKGDMVHRVTAYLEHLMDLFEVALAIIVAIGFILELVIGIEFIKMLVKHTPGSVIEVLLFAISRHAILEGGNAVSNLLTVCAIAVIFAIRRFLYIESFDFLSDNSKQDWLSDWKSIMKKGNEEQEEETK